jgi:predicted HicB family RNase H-like nuclease
MTNDNLDQAMHDEASRMELTIRSGTGAVPGEPAMKQVMVRATTQDHERWKQAAAERGLSLTEWVRVCCNQGTIKQLDCPHPSPYKKFYLGNWYCMDCGTIVQ